MRLAQRPALLLHLADDVGRDGRVEVDGVVAQALGALVAFSAAAFKRLAHTDLCAVAVLGVILDTVHILRKTIQSYSGFSDTGFSITTVMPYFCSVKC